uniref:Uncharacterized protein n=1 Tax=Anguilla anguilla TaxID=7936 RepID=A0A0E9QVV8_ANGAN
MLQLNGRRLHGSVFFYNKNICININTDKY